MGIANSLKSWLVGFVVERPVKKLTLAELATRLETSGQQTEQRIVVARDTPANRERVRHIVGIERWDQRRLRVALGEPPLTDEYDDYRPAPDFDRQVEFRAARRETVALVHQIEEAGADVIQIRHNQIGDLSVRGWLRYLTLHADLESKRLR